MRSQYLFVKIIFLLIVLVFFNTCKKEKDIEDEIGIALPLQYEKNGVIYKSTTKIIEKEINDNISVFDSTQLVFQGDNSMLDSVKEGDILISGISNNTPYGYLRKVVDISRGNNQYQIKTENAYITDAVEEMDIDTTVELDLTKGTIVNGLKSSAVILDNKNLNISFVIYDKDGNQNTKNDQIRYEGSLDIEPFFEFKLKIKAALIKEFRIAGSIDFTLTNMVILEENLTTFNAEILPAYLDIRLPSIEPSGFVITPYLRIYLGVEGNVNNLVTAEYTTNLKLYAEIKKEKGKWTQQYNKSINNLFTFEASKINAEAQAYIRPAIELEFFDYNNAKAMIWAKGYLELSINSKRNPVWELNAGLEVSAEIVLKALCGILDFNKEIPLLTDYETTLASGNSYNKFSSIKDERDGRIYKTVKIGNQWWMAENLNVGEKINVGKQQTNNGKIEKYYYNNDSFYGEEYGGLYQWDEAMQYKTYEKAQGVCPDGWHVPDESDWNILLGYLNGEIVNHWYDWQYTNVGEKIREQGNNHWVTDGNANNESGFTVLDAQCYWQTEFNNFFLINREYKSSSGDTTSIWSSSQGQWDKNFVFLNLWSSQEKTYLTLDTLKRQSALPIRCVKD